jgi:hypothetical protein
MASASPTSATGSPASASAVPGGPASDQTIEAFLAFARAPQSFSVDIEAEFTVGKQTITYTGTGYRSGPDGVEILTQMVDGQAAPLGMGVVGGRAFIVSEAGWTPMPPDNVAVLGPGVVSFAQALVLEDLGQDAAGGHLLQVSAGFSIYPPQMASIADAHDLTDRLEVVVDDAGLPLSAVYTRSLSGTIDGAEGTASGRATYTFRDVGKPVAVPSPTLAPGATLTPAVTPSPPPSFEWTQVPLAYAPLRLEMPGVPEVSSQTVPNEQIGAFAQRDHRLVLRGSKYTVIESQLPQSYIDAQGAEAIAREAAAIEARNLGATVVGVRPLVGTAQPGIDAVLATQTALYRLRILVVGRDVIELGVAGAPAAVASAEADRFLTSVAGS